jgi:hypothetical protein
MKHDRQSPPTAAKRGGGHGSVPPGLDNDVAGGASGPGQRPGGNRRGDGVVASGDDALDRRDGASRRVAPGSMAPGSMAPGSMAPGRMAPGRVAPRGLARPWLAARVAGWRGKRGMANGRTHSRRLDARMVNGQPAQGRPPGGAAKGPMAWRRLVNDRLVDNRLAGLGPDAHPECPRRAAASPIVPRRVG